MSNIRPFVLKKILIPVSDIVMKTALIKSYNQLKFMYSYSSDEIKHWQNEQLNKLLNYAYKHTKYYNRLFTKERLLPNDIKSISDLERLPVLTKDIIRNNFTDIISDNIYSRPSIKSATGGSSGDPLIYYQDNLSWSMCNANNILNWEKTGYKFGDKYIALGSTSLFVKKTVSFKHKIYYRLKGKIGLNGINMSRKICDDYIDLIKNSKIRYIYGYASAIYLLAKHILEHNKNLTILACFPTSEMLTDQYRNTIQEAFRCKILDCYGANDGGITAFAHKKDYYEVGYNCLMRIQDINKRNHGPILVTDLFNFSMPFINYKLGDEIQIDYEKNRNHQYNGQIINKVLGRTSDIIQLENGHTLTGPGFTILFKELPIEHYYIHKTGINTIECLIIKLPGFTQSHEDIIRSTFNKHAGTNINIVYTTKIPLTESGKRKYFQN